VAQSLYLGLNDVVTHIKLLKVPQDSTDCKHTAPFITSQKPYLELLVALLVSDEGTMAKAQ
jgi:hypothetical protein